MKFQEMDEAIREARATLSHCDYVAGEIAAMLCGRLRKVNSAGVLTRLKRELRGYNIHTDKWKD